MNILQKFSFNYEFWEKTLLSLGQGNIHKWLEKHIPNTRLIIEPKIIGSDIGIQYIEVKFNKAINELIDLKKHQLNKKILNSVLF